MPYPGPVRIAEHGDEEEVLVLCRRLCDENGMYPMSEGKVRDMMRRAFDRQGGILGVVGNTKIEGMIYMLVSTLWYTEESQLDELFLFVAPEYRKSRNAVELMKFAKWCSNKSGLSLMIGVISNHETEGKVRLYQRQFKSAGSFFYYKANGAEKTA